MPYRPDGDFLQDDESRWDAGPEEAEGGGWWKWAVAVLALVLFVGVVWYAYSTGATGPIGPVRTVEADTKPYKLKPQNPGGEIIPDQDKLVFNEAVGRTTDTEDMLGSGPEAPQSRPEPIIVRKFTPPVPAPKPAPPPVAPAEASPPAGTEAAPGTVTPPPAAAPGQPGAVPVKVADASKAVPAVKQEALKPEHAKPGAVPVTPGQAPLPAAAAPAVPDATIPPAAPPPAAEAKPEGGKSPVVQLGAYGTEAGAMESWAQVQRKQGSIVAGLSPRVIKFSAAGKGDLYRLVIGPFADRSAATSVCSQLKAQGRDCIVNAH